MEWLVQNWYVILFVILAVVVVIYAIMTNKVKEWLKYAVTLAEKELGTSTGQLKLRQVYDAFVTKFPIFSKIIPFTIFSKWVDLALEWLDIQLSQNKAIKDYVDGVQ